LLSPPVGPIIALKLFYFTPFGICDLKNGFAGIFFLWFEKSLGEENIYPFFN
jgi:hypothetical protein